MAENVVGETEDRSTYYRPQCHYLTKRYSKKDEGFPYYPNFDLKPIPVDPPSVYYQRKIRYKPPPEKECIRKIVPHKVDPEKLSENQKPFAGKTLFEKDLIIIEQRNQLLAKNRNYRSEKPTQHKKRAQSVNLHQKRKVVLDKDIDAEEEEEEFENDSAMNLRSSFSISPPNVFYREEEKRQIKKSEKDRQIELLKKQQRREEIRHRHRFEKDKKKIDTITKERESERINQEKMMIEEKEKELQKKKEKYKKFKQEPLKSTRTTNLRAEVTSHKIEADRADQQREKLNSKLKKERLRKQTKRISKLIQSMNQDYNIACRARQKTEEMKKTERGWYRWLEKSQKSNEKKETMLERTLFATD